MLGMLHARRRGTSLCVRASLAAAMAWTDSLGVRIVGKVPSNRLPSNRERRMPTMGIDDPVRTLAQLGLLPALPPCLLHVFGVGHWGQDNSFEGGPLDARPFQRRRRRRPVAVLPTLTKEEVTA